MPRKHLREAALHRQGRVGCPICTLIPITGRRGSLLGRLRPGGVDGRARRRAGVLSEASGA